MTPKGRRTSDINGAAAPPLNRRPSNSQLKQPSPVKRPATTGTQLSARNHSHVGAPADASPTLLRRKPSSTSLPTAPPPPPHPPRTPALAKSALMPRPLPRVVPRAPKSSQVPPSAPAAAEPPAPLQKISHQKASQSLRDTIRQARAAKQRAAPAPNGDPVSSAPASSGLDGFDFGTDDPFNQAMLGEGGCAKVLQQRIKSARVEGRLNISNLQLKEIPAAVYKMYETAEEDLTPGDDSGPKWYENVDLAKLIGADNEIAEVGNELAQQFAALSVIDVCEQLQASERLDG